MAYIQATSSEEDSGSEIETINSDPDQDSQYSKRKRMNKKK